MNITVDSDGNVKTEETFSKTVTQMNSLDCASGDMACKVPTLFEGLDADDVMDSGFWFSSITTTQGGYKLWQM